jgi:hypothetical protein
VIQNPGMPAIARTPPHSRMFRRGTLGRDLDGRSPEGRFLRHVEAALSQHVGGQPNFPQKLLIRRAARAMLRLELLDIKMAEGNWTEQDGRIFGGLNNAVRLCLRELGIKSAADKPLSVDSYLKHRSSADLTSQGEVVR